MKDEKTVLYDTLAQQLDALTAGEPLAMPNLANAAALIGRALPDINWAGFYLAVDGVLVLSSFWGAPACIRIAMGRGVCGTAAKTKTALVVPDVDRFPGHIACDARSKSEIVVPLIQNGAVVGVLDVDSPLLARFDERDLRGLSRLAEILAKACVF